MNRRSALAGVSLAAIAACTLAAGNASAQAVFAQIQYLLPVIRTLAVGISALDPKAAGLVAQITPYLDQAAAAFQGLSAAMTEVQARPIAQQVVGYVRSALDAVAGVVNAATPGSSLAKFAPEIAAAQSVLALVMMFAQGAQAMPTKAMAHLPLLHR